MPLRSLPLAAAALALSAACGHAQAPAFQPGPCPPGTGRDARCGTVPGYGGMRGAGCVDALLVRFIRQGSVAGLDTSCVRRMRRPPFVVHIPEPIVLNL